MLRNKKSYLAVAAIIAALVTIAPGVSADMIYLDPDTLLLTEAVGTEFDLELKVDAIDSLKFFKVYYHFAPDILDTISFTQGPLFLSAGAGTWPGADLYGNDTVMALEDFIYGAGIAVNGPGTLYTVRLKALAPGKADLAEISHIVKDVNGDTVLCDGFGATIFVDYPPVPFLLVEPYEGQVFDKYPRDSVELIWNSTASVYPGEGAEFRLEYGTSETFEPEATEYITGLSVTDTTFMLYTSDMIEGGTTYWRVVATGDIYGYEREAVSYFDLNVMDPISAFDITLPQGGQVTKYPMDSVRLVWTESGSVYDGEGIEYVLEYGTSETFEPGLTTTISGITDTFRYLYVDILGEGSFHWRVTAVGDTYGFSRAADTDYKSFTLVIASPLAAFTLLDPGEGQSVTGPPAEYYDFEWSGSMSVYPGDNVSYRFELSTDPFFTTLAVPSVTIPGTQHSVLLGELEDNDYFWRVSVVSNTYGYERHSTPWPASFEVQIVEVQPASFNLLSPTDSAMVDVTLVENPEFTWESADNGVPNDTITYDLYLVPYGGGAGSETLLGSVANVTSLSIDRDLIPRNVLYSWYVVATNKFDLSVESEIPHEIVSYKLGDPNADGKVTLSDLTRTIDYVYISKTPPYPKECVDITCDGKATLSDITGLIDHIYISKSPLGCP